MVDTIGAACAVDSIDAIDNMALFERRFMDRDKYLDDWYLSDEEIGMIEEYEYKMYLKECGDMNGE